MGARLNTRKSKVLTEGGWSTSTDRLNIPYHAEIKILGVTFAITIEYSMNKSWVNVTGPVKGQKREEIKPLTTVSLSASIPPGYNMAHGPSVPGSRHPRSIPDN